MTKVFVRALAGLVMLGLSAAGARAVQPDEMLKDPQLESRARTISAELRCLVCQNQSIDDSDAPLARDLRILVRERLRTGDSDGQVLQFLVDRYGDFILLKPRLSAKTYILWIAPLLIFLMGIVLARRQFRPTQVDGASTPITLTANEQQRLREILDGKAAPRR
jgi:cytochrome c-type biogenesis protein CcmH